MHILGIEAEQEAVTRHIQLHLLDDGVLHRQSDIGGDQVHDDVLAVVEFDSEHFPAFIRESASAVEKGAAACACRCRCFNDIVTQSAGDERKEDFMTGIWMGIFFIHMQAFTMRTQQARNRTCEEDATIRQLEMEK